MEQQVDNLFNPLPLVISPDAEDQDNCLGAIIRGNYSTQRPAHNKYKPIVGKASSGDMIKVCQFMYSVNVAKSTDDNYTETGCICDVVNGKYICFESMTRISFMHDNYIHCDGVATCVMKYTNSTIWLYKQGNLPWYDSQKVGCDAINILEIKIKFNDRTPVAFNILSRGSYNYIVSYALVEADGDNYYGYPIDIDVKRLLETSVPTITTRVGKAGDNICSTFNVCSVEITIDDITSSVEPDSITARTNLRPDRPVWFTTTFCNLYNRYLESLYDERSMPRLVVQLRNLMFPVFVDMVARYLVRQMPD